MKATATAIDGAIVIEPRVFTDKRGFFLETFQHKKYAALLGDNIEFVQDNHSSSSAGVLRGLHFQRNNPQGKLVRVVHGEVFDVAVDLRLTSPTFGNYVGLHLSAENKLQFWLPPGLAHGFVVLSERAEFEYKCSGYYDANDEACLLWNDPDLAIPWPITNPILSEKDLLGESFKSLTSNHCKPVLTNTRA